MGFRSERSRKRSRPLIRKSRNWKNSKNSPKKPTNNFSKIPNNGKIPSPLKPIFSPENKLTIKKFLKGWIKKKCYI